MCSWRSASLCSPCLHIDACMVIADWHTGLAAIRRRWTYIAGFRFAAVQRMSSKPRLSLTAAFIAVLAGADGSVAADDLSTLKGEVQQLQQELRSVQQDLEQIKQLLAGRRPQPPGWERVENALLTLDDAPQRGEAKAPLVLLEFSDYQ